MWRLLLIYLGAPGSVSAFPKWSSDANLVGSLGAKRKMQSFNMGCDCGKQKETAAEKAACEESAILEAPDQVHI